MASSGDKLAWSSSITLHFLSTHFLVRTHLLSGLLSACSLISASNSAYGIRWVLSLARHILTVAHISSLDFPFNVDALMVPFVLFLTGILRVPNVWADAERTINLIPSWATWSKCDVVL